MDITREERLEIAEIELSKIIDNWKYLPKNLKSILTLAFNQGMMSMEILEAKGKIIELKNEIRKIG